MKKVSENQKIMDEKIKKAGSIAVCSVYEAEKAVLLAKKLLSKNVSVMEIAYRKLDSFDKTDECIKAIRKNVPEMLVGAATVVNASLAKRAVKAGAMFILSPGFNPETVSFCLKNKIPVYPGVLTPSEIERALEYGLKTLKFFPAEIFGGCDYLKCLSGPFPQLSFIVSGGLNEVNQEKYRSLSNVAAVSGSWLSKDLLQES